MYVCNNWGGGNILLDLRLEAMTIQFVVLSVVTPHSDVVGHQCFRGSCCIHPQGEVSGI